MTRCGHSYTSRARRAGFSLVELIVVIVITGIIAGVTGVFILRPVQGYNAQVRRADMVDAAEAALRRMQRDVRAALPNSMRIRTPLGATGDVTCPGGGNDVCVVEIVHTVDGARYRAGPPGDELLFNGSDTTFQAIGGLTNASAINVGAHWLVINNQTNAGATFNAYNCAGGASHNCVLLNASTNLASSPPQFALANAFSPTTPSLASPRQRFFIVDTPVTYLCDTGAGTLTRYHGYTMNADHSLRDTHIDLTGAGATVATAATLVRGCRFTYTAGTNQRAGLLTLELTIQDSDVNGQVERVRLLHQVHVYNVP